MKLDTELKTAFFKQEPVIYNGMVYRHIEAVTYKMTETGLKVCLVLRDRRCNNSVTEALASRVSVLKGDGK